MSALRGRSWHLQLWSRYLAVVIVLLIGWTELVACPCIAKAALVVSSGDISVSQISEDNRDVVSNGIARYPIPYWHEFMRFGRRFASWRQHFPNIDRGDWAGIIGRCWRASGVCEAAIASKFNKINAEVPLVYYGWRTPMIDKLLRWSAFL